jgi:hypothetical protein
MNVTRKNHWWANFKKKESKPDLDSDSEHNKRKEIIDAESTYTIVTIIIQPEE